MDKHNKSLGCYTRPPNGFVEGFFVARISKRERKNNDIGGVVERVTDDDDVVCILGMAADDTMVCFLEMTAGDTYCMFLGNDAGAV